MPTLAVMQALLGFTNDTQWLRCKRKNLLAMFPTVPLPNRGTAGGAGVPLRSLPG